MELFGSLSNISGSVSASVFTGSYIGDGAGLYNLPASGVVGLNLSQIATGSISASLSPYGFNVNTDTSITGSLIVSGDTQISGALTASGLIYPTTDALLEKQFITSDTNGNLSWDDVHTMYEHVQAGESLVKTDPIYLSGSVGAIPIAYKSIASDPTTMPAVYVMDQNLNTGEQGRAIALGLIEGIDLTGLDAGDIAYVGSSGGWTTTRPTGTDLIQALGVVTKGGGGGKGFVFNAGVSDLPNIATNKLWIGDTTHYPVEKTIDEIGLATTSSLTSLSSSVAQTDLNQNGRLDSIEGVTGSYATTGSNTFYGDQTISGSIIPTIDNAFDLGSPTYQWRDVYISSGSLYIDGTKVISSTAQELQITTDAGQSIKILEGTTDSIILQTADGNVELKSSADGDILLDPTNGKILLKGTVEVLNGQKIQSSVGGTPVVFANDIVVSGSIDITGTIEGINLTDFSSSLNSRLGNLESGAGSLNEFTASAITRLNSIESTTSSLNTYTSSADAKFALIESVTSSFASYSGATDSRLGLIETSTGSLNTFSSSTNSRLASIESTTASLTSANTTQDGRLDSLEGKTGSYATTGSNSFLGNQTITGSLIVTNDFTVLGSSSLLFVTTSQLAVSSSTISVNIFEPAERFGGLVVYDSGSLSHQATASLLWDSLHNHWVYQNVSGAGYSGGMLISGPRNTGSLGDEPGLTNGKIAKSIGGDHIGDSIITEIGGGIGIDGNLAITGSIVSSTTTLVSGSSQIDHNSTTNYDANKHVDHTAVSITAGNGLSGGGTIASTRTLTLDTGSTHFNNGVKAKLNTEGVVSGSSQITYGSISGIPSGIVSGSSQVSFNGISDKPALVSGSSQISFSGISGIPGGLVSGSSQIDLTATTNYSTGIKTRLNAEGVVSGSSQISFGSMSGVPSGLVSGSSQITLSSTTGYGSVLNQAVLTSSTPTFSGAILTNVLRGGIGAATTGGVTNWNDSTNARSGQGHTLLTGNATNGPGPSEYFHPFSFEYSNKDGSGNLTQFAIPYNANQTSMYFRGRYDGTWGSWYTMWNSGNLTNLNQLTNGPGYITGITFANVSSKPTTLSGYGITDALSNDSDSEQDVGGRHFRFNHGTNRINIDPRWNESGYDADMGVFHMYSTTAAGVQWGRTGLALYNGSAYQYLTTKASTTGIFLNNNAIWHGGNDGSGSGLDSDLLDGYHLEGATSVATRIFNNKGQVHNTYTNFNTAMSPGPNYIQQGTNGPTNTASHQWYGFMFGLGGEYGTTTGTAGHYASQLYYSRIGEGGGQYLWARDMESGTWGSWRKLHAGYADTAGNITAYTINQNLGTSNSVKFGSHCDLNISNSAFRFYDGSTFRGGLGTDDWAHSGSAANITLFASGVLHFTSGGSKRAYFDTSGHLLPQTNNTYDLGSASLGWRNVYTNDLHLSNMNKPEGNDVDGTNGNWTIQEGAENLYIINNNNGKKFKISLEEII